MENKIKRHIYGKYYTTEYELILPLANIIVIKSYYNDSKKEIFNISIQSSTSGIKEITFTNNNTKKTRTVRFSYEVNVTSYNLINLAIMHIIDNFDIIVHQYIIFEVFDDLKFVEEAKRFHRLWDNPIFSRKLQILNKKNKIANINKKICSLQSKLIAETQSLFKYQNEFDILLGPNKFCLDSNIH